MSKHGSPYRCYLSWVARNNDPWPHWWDPLDDDLKLKPEDDPKWPGVPFALKRQSTVLDTGPTLATLLHPGSSYADFKNLDAVCLLYRSDDERDSHERLKDAMGRICAARGLEQDFKSKVHFIPIDHIADPTNHEQVCAALGKYLKGLDNPLRLNESKLTREVIVNLSPGTPTMHACWLMLYWRGAFGPESQSTVVFIQGDGGRSAAQYTDEAHRDPVRPVPVDVIARFSAVTTNEHEHTRDGADRVRPTLVGLDKLKSSKYVELRTKIAKAAMLGLPIVLVGPRGTGKTFLAQHYHQRRQEYLARQGRLQPPPQGLSKDKAGRKRPSRRPVGPPLCKPRRTLVPVTLSEYLSVDDLSSTLFGWKAGTFTGADSEEDNDGLLGEAHQGTLFLDEIHHLNETLQAALLGAMNTGRYRPGKADYEIQSDFSLVIATNEPEWEKKLLDDFRDRIVRVVLNVPSFEDVRKDGLHDLEVFWNFVLRKRCLDCEVRFTEPPHDCNERLMEILRNKPLEGNWRDLARLADHLLMELTEERNGRPTGLNWDVDAIVRAIDAAVV